MLISYLSDDGEIQSNTYMLHYYSRIYILSIAKKFSKILLRPLLVLTLQWLVHNWCFGSSDSLLPYYQVLLHNTHTSHADVETNGASLENTYCRRVFGDARRQDLHPHSPHALITIFTLSCRNSKKSRKSRSPVATLLFQ